MSSIKSLHKMQYLVNNSMSDRKRVEKRWVINKKDFDKDKAFQELLVMRGQGIYTSGMEDVEMITHPPIPPCMQKSTDQFYDGLFKAWEEVFESIPQTDFKLFGTSAVRNAYWKIEKPKKTPRPKRQTVFSRETIPKMVFRRFDNLLPEEERNYYSLDILVKALLGFPEAIGYKLCNNKAILDDNWTINLKSSGEQDILAAFLMGFAA